MTDLRKEGLISFVEKVTGIKEPELISLNGDASFRRYFRCEGYIAVDSDPKTQKNHEFYAIDKALSEAGIKVPEIISIDYDRGYMLLEDLGQVLFSEVAVGEHQRSWYEKAIELLPKLVKIPASGLPLYDANFVNTELGIFKEWMLDKHLKLSLSDEDKAMLSEAFAFITRGFTEQERVAVHRDFHSRNIMICEKAAADERELALIDFQDMVYGPVTYDLASILFDCYVNLDAALIDSLSKQAYDLYKKAGLLASVTYEDFLRSLTITSLQRHVKVLGIFVRLYLRDHKSGYLKDLPRVLAYTLKEAGSFKELAGFVEFLKKHVEGHLPCVQ